MGSEFSNYCGTESLLIVDDDKSVLSLLLNFFDDYGYNVIIARDGIEAVDAYINNLDKIHLVLMDIVMPRKDGIAASIEIRAHNPDAIIYFMSGYSPESNAAILENYFIKKPFLPSKLIKIIRNHLDGLI